MFKLDFCSQLCRKEYRQIHGELFCGCGKKHKIEPFGEFVIHFRNQHWVMDCITLRLMEEQEQERKTIRLIYCKLKKIKGEISNLICSNCNNMVGKNYKIFGNAIYCSNCSHDTGGESNA